MAAVIGTLRAVLSAQMAEFTDGMSKAANQVATFQKKFVAVGRSMQRTGAVMSAAVTAPLVMFANESRKSARDFQASMSDVSTLVDTTKESMAGMGREVLAISRNVPVAISDLTEALYDVRSAGVDAADSMDVLEGSARLAVAGLGSTKEATDIATSAINAFGLEGEKQKRIYDVVFKTVKNGKTTISELAQGFGAVAGTVANANIEIDEYLASVAALTTTGLPAAQAHTQIRAAIAGLTRETKETSAVFSKLGAENFKDLVKQSGGMVSAFQRIIGALDGNDAAIIKLVGSVEAYNAMMGLAGGQNDTFRSTLNDMREGANAVDEAFDKQNQTAQALEQRWTNTMESIRISVGTIVLPIVEKFQLFAIKLADAFNSLSPATQEWIVQMAALAAAIGPVLIVLGTLMTTFSGIVKIVPLAMTAAKGVGVAMALMGGPITLAIAAIAALAAAWYFYGDEIKAAAQRVFTAVDEALGGGLTVAIDAVKVLIDGFIEHVKLTFQFLGQLLTGDLAGAFQTFLDAFRNVWETARAFLDTILSGFTEMLTGWGAEVVQIVADTVTGIGTWLRDKLGAIFDFVRDKVTGTISVFRDMYQAVVGGSYVPDMIDGIESEFGRLPDVMVNPARDAATAVGDAFSGVIDTLSGLFDKLLSDGKLTFDDLKKAALDLAKQLFINPFFNALKGGLSGLFGGGGGLFGGGFPPAPSFGGLFAAGGVLGAGEWGIAGEAGPEIVRGPATIEPMDGGGWGQRNVTVNMEVNTPDADSFRASQRQTARMLKQRFAI